MPRRHIKKRAQRSLFCIAVLRAPQILSYGPRMRLVDLQSAADNSCDIGAPSKAAPPVLFHDLPIDGLSRAPHFCLSRRIHPVVATVGNVDRF